MDGVGGGQTREDVSGWTVDTLHSHILSLLQERDRRWEEVLAERGRYLERVFSERDQRYTARFAASQTAVDKSEREMEGWKHTTNEWRGAMQDKDKLLMARPEITSELNALRTSIGTLRNLSLSAILVSCSVITVILLIVRPHL